MLTSIKHLMLQVGTLVSWLFLVILPITNENVDAQITCPDIKYLAPLPGWSWHANATVRVKIDDG